MCKPSIYRLAIFQCVVFGILLLLIIPLGWVIFYSVLLGVFLVIIPQAYFAYRVFQYQGAQFAHFVLRSFYIGEAVKIVLTGAGFAVIFVWVHPLNVFAMLLAFWVGQFLFFVISCLLYVKSA